MKEQTKKVYKLLKETVDAILEQGLENEQWAMDWLDSINEQSVRF